MPQAENELWTLAGWVTKEAFSKKLAFRWSWKKNGREVHSRQREQHAQKLGGECRVRRKQVLTVVSWELAQCPQLSCGILLLNLISQNLI